MEHHGGVGRCGIGISLKPVNILRGYKTELLLNDKQATACRRHAGAARWAYNWGLAQKKAAIDGKLKIPSAIELHRRLTALKKTECPWLYEVSKCSPQEALRNLDSAVANFFNGRKSGRRVGFPKFKSRKSGIGTFRLNGTIKVGDGSVQLPRLGVVRLKERGYLPVGCNVINATVSERAGRWFVSVLVEEEIECNQFQKDAHGIVGLDVGIKTLATVSDGTSYGNPKPLNSSLKRLKRLQRGVSRKVRGSRNRAKAKTTLARLYFRISNIRKDTLHKMTTTLAKTKRVVGIEDLNVSGMMKNRRLSRHIADLGLHELRRQLEYKGRWYDCNVVPIDRFFPSSKMCSSCGKINDNLTLTDRRWTCECGATHDRDMNAAHNLEHVAASLSETKNACGVDGYASELGVLC